MSAKTKILRGLSWTLVSRIGVQLFQFAFGVALARTLSPAEFGVFGMLIAFTGFAQVLSEGGLNAAIIHKQDVTEVVGSTAFWLQVFFGLAMSVIFFIGAPVLAHFYETPTLTSLTQLVAWVFLIQSLGQTHYAKFAKDFRFKALAIANITSTFVSGVVAIVLALEGYGVWALAWQVLLAAIGDSTLYWLQSKWRPRFMFSMQAALELWRYSIYLLGHTSLNYWLRNADKLVIGKFLGANELGAYARAYSFMLLPLNNIGSVLGRVMFPALAEMQNDIPRFGRLYLMSVQTTALVTFPMMAGMAALADPFVLTLLGDKWVSVIPILQILSFVGLFQSIVFPVVWVFNALGKTKQQFHLGLLYAVIFIVSIALGLRGGVIGVAVGYAVCALICGIIALHVAGGYLGITVGRMLVSVARITLMSLVMGTIVFFLDAFLLTTYPSPLRLVAGIVVGAICYIAFCLVSRDPTFKRGTDLVVEALRKRRAP